MPDPPRLGPQAAAAQAHEQNERDDFSSSPTVKVTCIDRPAPAGSPRQFVVPPEVPKKQNATVHCRTVAFAQIVFVRVSKNALLLLFFPSFLQFGLMRSI